jgi:hypothetical protein
MLIPPEDDGDDANAPRLQLSELPNNFKPLECARDRVKAKKKAKVDEDDVEWLRTSASERFGHEHFQRFQRRRHRVLQNVDIVALWQFAAQFCEAYHTKKGVTSVSG